MSAEADPSERGRVPAGHGAAYRLAAGDALDVSNPYGSQVADVWAFAAEDPREHLSMDHTRSVLSRLSPRVGDALVSNRRRPFLALDADTSPGIHDTLLCPCNAALYEELGAPAGHRSCEGNLHEALAAIGVTIPFTPASFNVFMNVDVGPGKTIVRGDPVSRPGDYVRLRALRDLVLVVSACPQDITRINGPDRTPRPLDVAIRRAASGPAR